MDVLIAKFSKIKTQKKLKYLIKKKPEAL